LPTFYKKAFVLIITFFYSPASFLGKKMVKGIRQILSDTLHYKSASGISYLLKNGMYQYGQYTNDKATINKLFDEVESYLIKEGIVRAQQLENNNATE
jgi:hypothetical protein